MSLTLRLPVQSDERRVRELSATFSAEGFDFLAGIGQLEPVPGRGEAGGSDWENVLRDIRRYHDGVDLPDGMVPADFLLAEIRNNSADGADEPTIIGRVSIRYGLTDWLLNYGGHVGYAVAPEYRRRGYATEILRQSLILLAQREVRDVLVTCADDNLGSVAVIEANGGVLENRRLVPGDEVPMRRYWISQ